MNTSQLYHKLNSLPENMKIEVQDFIDFLLEKKKKAITKKTPQFGCAKGLISISNDFNEPLDDFKDYM